jgi:hypothetical protein
MKTLICLLALQVTSLQAGAGVVAYPAPADEPLSTDYQVSAGGQKIDVYTARVLDPPFAGKQYDYGGPAGGRDKVFAQLAKNGGKTLSRPRNRT